MTNFTRPAILKYIEFIIVCILIGLHYHSFAGGQHTEMVTMGTFGAYLIILFVLILGIFMETPVNRRLDLIFSIIGCVLFIIAGSINVDFFRHILYQDDFRVVGLSKGCISIIEGFIFLVDAYFIFQEEN